MIIPIFWSSLLGISLLILALFYFGLRRLKINHTTILVILCVVAFLMIAIFSFARISVCDELASDPLGIEGELKADVGLWAEILDCPL